MVRQTLTFVSQKTIPPSTSPSRGEAKASIIWIPDWLKRERHPRQKRRVMIFGCACTIIRAGPFYSRHGVYISARRFPHIVCLMVRAYWVLVTAWRLMPNIRQLKTTAKLCRMVATAIRYPGWCRALRHLQRQQGTPRESAINLRLLQL